MTYTILVVDDSALNRKLVTTILKAKQFDVLEAEDGEQAFDLAAAHQPDLVLMDVQLPKEDGYSVTRRLRQNPSTQSLKIIALTAHAMAQEEERAREAGCDGYLSKPIDTRTLVPNILALLEGSGDLP
ncbi:MAG: response regulator [Anaerolineales bacterium]|nr:response regulator [Anaerolineales bacterium]